MKQPEVYEQSVDRELINEEGIYLFPTTEESDSDSPQPFAADVVCQPEESEPETIGIDVSWRTLISSDRTNSSDFVLGIAEIRADGMLPAHRHQPAEFYLGLSGCGIVTVEGVEYRISAGISIFIPENSEHSVLAGGEGLSFAYGFARDSFAEISYELSIDDLKHA